MVKRFAHNEKDKGSSPFRKNFIGGRVVYCGGLLNRYTSVSGVQIPLYPKIYYVVEW